MYDNPIRTVMRRRGLIKAASDATVRKAVKQMARRDAGAVLVIDGDRLVGIFTERDAVFRVMAPGLDAAATRLRDVMTRDPHTIGPDQPFGVALALMHEKRFRHLPVLDKGKLVGLVSARSAMDPDLEDFRAEARRRERFQR
ncbi:Hypoxic response protein 1 [Burkholderiales bacterium]|nr:Hypoxic response protein 1 [Burkholderiales bacterium]